MSVCILFDAHFRYIILWNILRPRASFLTLRFDAVGHELHDAQTEAVGHELHDTSKPTRSDVSYTTLNFHSAGRELLDAHTDAVGHELHDTQLGRGRT